VAYRYPLIVNQEQNGAKRCQKRKPESKERFNPLIIGKLHPHMLRHTYLTRLYNVEKDLRFVQDQAGHASPTTTAIYAKTNNTARKRQVEALDEEL